MHTTKKGFLAAVEATMRRHRMVEPGDTILVGVSGGPDSIALLHALMALGPKWSLRFVVAHLNHQLRGVIADQEAAFVERLGRALGLSCEIGSKDVSSYSARQRLSIQEGARVLRYAFYDQTAAKYGARRIALGHQADDNTESILIHLLRGTGPRGLAGIPPVRDGHIIRPLIDLSRTQILEFLKQSGFEYMRDHSNLDSRYLRNRIRWELLPFLSEHFNPGVASSLTRLASILREEEDFWNEQVGRIFQDLLLEKRADSLTVSAPGLGRLHPALLRRLVRHAVFLLKGDMRRLGHRHVEAVVRLSTGPSPAGRLDLPKGLRVVRDRDEVRFLLGRPRERLVYEYQITGIGTTFIREIGVYLKLSVSEAGQVGQPRAYPSNIALFDFGAVSFPLLVRTFKEGDRFRPLGMSGSQKIKAFFINQKVPRWARQQCPILLSGGKVIWVGGYRMDDSVKLTEETKTVLKAELLAARSKGLKRA